MATVTGMTVDAIEDGLEDVRSAVRVSQFGASPSKTAAQNTAAILQALATANTFGIPIQIDQRLHVNSINLANEDLLVVGSGELVQQLGQNVFNVQRTWGNPIDVNPPSLMKFGNDGVQGAANVSIISVPTGGYNRFENGDAFHVSSNDVYSWNASSGGSEVFQQVKAGMFSVLGVGLTIGSIANGGPVEGVILQGVTSGSTGTVQSVISQSGTSVNVVFSKVSADFINGENLIVQTGGSTALASGTLVGVAGVMYLIKAGVPFVDTYLTSVKIRKINRSIVTKIDVRVTALDWDSYVPANQRKDAVVVEGAYDVDVKMEVDGCWSRALALVSCYYGTYDVKVDGAPNHTGADQGGFGYGVSLQGACEELDGRIKVRNVRHGHTTNVNYTVPWSADGKRTLSNGTIVDAYRQWGTSKYCRCTGEGADCTNVVFDTHPGAMFFEFYDAVAKAHSGMGRNASTNRNGFSDRGIGTKYTNCHAIGCGFSDAGAPLETGFKYQRVYKGCRTTDAPQYGFSQLFPAAPDGVGGFWQELIIEDCNFHMDGTTSPYSAQRPILLSTCDAKIRNTSVSNFNDAPVYISSTSSNGTYRFVNFSCDYTKGPGRKPFQIAGTVDIFVDYYVDFPSSGLQAVFETVSGGTNIAMNDIKRMGGSVPPLLLNTSGSGQITYRGFRLIRRVTTVGDSSFTMELSGTGSVIRYNTPLSATRTVTLPTDGSAINGDGVKVVRTTAAGSVTGYRYLNVVAGATTLAVMEPGQTAEFRHDGTSWFLEDIKSLSGINGALADNSLSVGTETIPRNNVGSYITMTSGTLRLAYYTHRKSENCTRMRVISGSTPAAATPTLVKFALFSIDLATGNLTRIAITANDTTTFSQASTSYTKNFLSSVDLIAGLRYVIGVLVVSTATVPTVAGNIPLLPSFEMGGTDPILSKAVTGQTDIAASYTAASLADSNNMVYAVVRP